jgi:hypothetical protein
MGIEASDTIAGLNENWPLGSDPKSEGDNHIRLIKHVLKQAFHDGTDGVFKIENMRFGLVGGLNGFDILDVDGNPHLRVTATDAGQATFETFDDAGTSKAKYVLGTAGNHFFNDIFIEKADGTKRGGLIAPHANEGAGTLVTAYDGAGVLQSLFSAMGSFTGAFSTSGQFRIGKTDQTMRAMLNPEVTANAGKVEVRAVNNDQTVAGSVWVDNNGLTYNLELCYQGVSFIRSRIGLDSTYGAYWKYYAGGDGSLGNIFHVDGNGANISSPNGFNTSFRAKNYNNGFLRGQLWFNSDGGTPALAQLYAYDNAGARQQRIDFDNAGIHVIDGAAAGDCLTTGNFPARNSTNAALDFIVGTHLLFSCPSASKMNRNLAVTMRLHATDTTMYQHTGSGGLLAGTWLSCGLGMATDPIVGMARRIA